MKICGLGETFRPGCGGQQFSFRREQRHSSRAGEKPFTAEATQPAPRALCCTLLMPSPLFTRLVCRDVKAIKPLGCLAMIDDGELDWKVRSLFQR